MVGKILPCVVVGYLQTVVFLLAAGILFDAPFLGSPFAFFAGFNLYVLTNLALGFLISTVARSQTQAMQIGFFTILPTLLLSGFMFPFAGMPAWAQAPGHAIPATHFLRLARKVMLKGAILADSAGDRCADACDRRGGREALPSDAGLNAPSRRAMPVRALQAAPRVAGLRRFTPGAGLRRGRTAAARAPGRHEACRGSPPARCRRDARGRA